MPHEVHVWRSPFYSSDSFLAVYFLPRKNVTLTSAGSQLLVFSHLECAWWHQDSCVCRCTHPKLHTLLFWIFFYILVGFVISWCNCRSTRALIQPWLTKAWAAGNLNHFLRNDHAISGNLLWFCCGVGIQPTLAYPEVEVRQMPGGLCPAALGLEMLIKYISMVEVENGVMAWFGWQVSDS